MSSNLKLWPGKHRIGSLSGTFELFKWPISTECVFTIVVLGYVSPASFL